MRNSLVDNLCRLAQDNPDIWLLTGDLGYSALEPFYEQFPDRFINVGVAEQNMAGIAAGLALSGKRVVIYSIINFVTLRCFEQIRNDICAHCANVIIVGVGAGYAYGAQGYTHHGLEDISVMRTLPNLDVAVPANVTDVETILHLAMQREGPTYIRLEKDGGTTASALSGNAARGRMACFREGEDAVIIATGGLVGEAYAAAQILAKQELSVAVWSCPWLAPFDDVTLEMLAKHYSVILTSEEGTAVGGLASAVALSLAEGPTSQTRLLTASVKDPLTVPTLSQASARRHHGLDAASLAARLVAVCQDSEIINLSD